MIHKILRTVLGLCLATHALADTLELSALGSLELAYSQPVAVEFYPGQPVTARVGYRMGDAFSLVAPGRVQQIEYLVETGAHLQQGESFAILRGPEMHHLQIEYEASKALLEASRRRFESNRSLYQRKAIRESQWIEVSENYYAATLEYEHLRHFYDLVITDENDPDPDSLTLAAPFASILDYAVERGAIEAGSTIAKFVPAGAIRLEARLPNSLRSQLAYLETARCRLAIDRVDQITSGFFVTAWTEPLLPECELMPGQQLLASPLLRVAAYRLPMSAVLDWEGTSHVFLREGTSLQLVPVDLLGAEEGNYILLSDTPLEGRDILVASVSAAQGVLLGLGGE